MTSAERAAFDAAAARWDEVMTKDLPDVAATIPQGACGYVPSSTTVSLPTSRIVGTIDDLRIDVWVGTIDGSGGILGAGGPCLVRQGDDLPAYGTMAFDAADLQRLTQSGELTDTVMHEMGHVLGFGTEWSGLLSGAGTNDPRFLGPNAVREWHALGGSGGVPVENCLDANGQALPNCGAGTRDAHWREAVFGDELMTGYLDPTDPLSRVTIGALQDLGYAVDYRAADRYAAADLAAQSVAPQPQGTFLLLTPQGTLP